MAMNTDWIDVTVLRESDKALKVTNGKEEAWIPKSQIVDVEEEPCVGLATRIELPVWLLEQEGLV